MEKNGLSSSKSPKTLTKIIACLAAVVIGFTTSMPFLLLISIIQPSLPFITPILFQAIITTLFLINVITWAASYYPLTLHTLHNLQLRTTAPVLQQVIIDSQHQLNNLFKIKNIIIDTDIILLATVQEIQLEINHLNNLIETKKVIDKELVKKRPLLTKLSQYNPLMWLFSYTPPYEKRLEELTFITNQLSTQPSNTKELIIGEHATYAEFLFQTIDSKLTQLDPKNIKEMCLMIPVHLLNKIALLNRLFSISASFALYGGFCLIAMLNIQSIGISYAILALFVASGSIIHFGHPITYLQLYGYTSKVKTTIKVKEYYSQNDGYFMFRRSIQKALSFFMVAGLAVSEYIALTTISEFLLAGKSILSIKSLAIHLLTHPLAASHISITFGLLGAVSVLIIRPFLLANVTNYIYPKKANDRTQISLRPLLSTTFIVTFIHLALIALHTVVYGGIFASILLQQALPLVTSILLVSAFYAHYKQNAHIDPTSSWYNTTISNAFTSITLLTNAVTACYLNQLAGSVYYLILGPVFASCAAILTGIAHLEFNRIALLRATPYLKAPSPSIVKKCLPITEWSAQPSEGKIYT